MTEVEFKSCGMVISQDGIFPGAITINKRGQEKLYEILKERFKEAKQK